MPEVPGDLAPGSEAGRAGAGGEAMRYSDTARAPTDTRQYNIGECSTTVPVRKPAFQGPAINGDLRPESTRLPFIMRSESHITNRIARPIRICTVVDDAMTKPASAGLPTSIRIGFGVECRPAIFSAFHVRRLTAVDRMCGGITGERRHVNINSQRHHPDHPDIRAEESPPYGRLQCALACGLGGGNLKRFRPDLDHDFRSDSPHEESGIHPGKSGFSFEE